MKNLAPFLDKLDDPDDISFYIGRQLAHKWDREDWWHDKPGIYHPTDNIWPHDRIDHIIEKHMGQPFAGAFSEYCSQVPVYQQRFFLEQFRVERRRYRYANEYFIDDEGNIGMNPAEKHRKNFVYYSDDYTTKRVHRITGKSIPKYWFKKFNDHDYHDVIATGYCLKFESATPEFKRLTQEQLRRRNRRRKMEQKARAEKAYSFLTQSEKEQRSERVSNHYKILKHGFDPETSFRGNSVNPDVIRTQRGY